MSRRVPPPALAARAASVETSIVRESLALTARPEVISFAGGLPAPDLFDVDGIHAAYEHVLTTSARRVLQYSITEGDPALREALVARLVRHGFPARPETLLVTSGAQQALTLLATALLSPGDTVVVENPTYLAALQCFRYAGVRVIAAPTDEQGIVVESLAEIAARERPKLLYLVPTFQNPTGHTLPAARRHAVARIAAEHGLWIVEDDPYGELRFRGEREPWISSFEEVADRAVLLGSLSKVMSPGMRLGWLHAPAELHRACVLVKQAFDLHTSAVDQAAAARYLTECDLDAHLRRVRSGYQIRCGALLAGLAEALPDGSTCNRPDGGMFVWVRLPDGYDATALLPHAIDNNVAYVPGAPFFAGKPDPATLRMSFTTYSPDEIRQGTDRLAKVFT